MLGAIAKKLFGSKNERDLKKLEPLVQAVNELEPNFTTLTDEAIRLKTEEFKERLSNGETVDDFFLKLSHLPVKPLSGP